MARTEIVYVTYIVASPETIWEALTRPEYTQQFYFGRSVESDWQIGSLVRYWLPDGQLAAEGMVTQCRRFKELALRWKICWVEALRSRPESTVTYKIENLKGVSRLTLREQHEIALDMNGLKAARRIWTIVLSGLKTLVETGKPLPKFDVNG